VLTPLGANKWICRQGGGVYDRDNSGKYKIKRINPPKKGGKAAKGIKSDYCVDMMAFILPSSGNVTNLPLTCSVVNSSVLSLWHWFSSLLLLSALALTGSGW
jgi:hypothetical protein